MNKSRQLCFVLAFVLASVTTTASAALVRIADPTYPYVVLDTDTSLEWLSPEITQGLTFNSTFEQVSAEFGPGGLYEGFRYATTADINTLFYSSAGMTPGDNVPAEAGAILMQDLFGFTFRSPDESFVALTGFFDDGTASHALAGVNLDYSLPPTTPISSSTDIDLSPVTTNSAEIGHWLLRDSEIPEPSALLVWSLLGFVGVGGAAWRRRHRQKRL